MSGVLIEPDGFRIAFSVGPVQEFHPLENDLVFFKFFLNKVRLTKLKE